MSNITLVRDIRTPDCTVGTLSLNGKLWQTLERPWVPGPPGGVKGVSCIPDGAYRLVRHDTEGHPRSFALVNEDLGVYHLTVPAGKQGRTACLIHVANKVAELRGCIALGMERVPEWELRRSRLAIDQFYAAVPWLDNQHRLVIA